MTEHDAFEAWADRQRAALPPVLYLPAGPPTLANAPQVEFDVLPDRRLALSAYTALDRLIDCCGSEQPWLLINIRELEELNRTSPFEVIYLDVPRAPDRRLPPQTVDAL